MKKVFLIHGYQGEPNGGWRPWLMGELAKKDIYACALPMPRPEEPEISEWVKTITDAVVNPNEEIFLVGHSLGVPAILRYLETLGGNEKIGGAVLVSGPISKLEKYDKKVNEFLNKPFHFLKYREVCSNFAIIHGDNDPQVPFGNAVEFSKNLYCKLISIPNGGHLNGSSGWKELPEALKALEEMMK